MPCISAALVPVLAAQEDISVRSTERHVSCAEYIRIQYGYKWSFIGPAAAVLIGFSALFMTINAFALKKLNFQQR